MLLASLAGEPGPKGTPGDKEHGRREHIHGGSFELRVLWEAGGWLSRLCDESNGMAPYSTCWEREAPKRQERCSVGKSTHGILVWGIAAFNPYLNGI